VIVVPVKEAVLAADIVFRADVVDADPIAIGAPIGVQTSAVVTAMPVHRGDEVHEGQRILEVSARPVFVLQGKIPAFRDMVPGSVGVDVKQLQAGLRRLGYSTSPDTTGSFGAGTQRALRSLYRRANAELTLTARDADTDLADLSDAVASATKTLINARSQLDADQESSAGSAVLKQDHEAVDAAQARVSAAEKTFRRAQASTGVTVPQGEIVFTPQLPARVVSTHARAGSKVPASGALTIGSGAVQLTGKVDPSEVDELTVGMHAIARSEVLGTSIHLRLNSIGNTTDEQSDGQEITVKLKPQGTVPSRWVGQNVAVTLTTTSSGGKVLIVPVAAVSTDGSGRTYVTVADRTTGRQREIAVTLGLSSGGEQAVVPSGGAVLKVADQVVVGQNVEAAP
jgi:HlyD family secretion protein